MALSKELHSAADLIKALEAAGCEPVDIEVATRKRTFRCLLTSAKKSGEFQIYLPTSPGDEAPFEMAYHILDVKVFIDR